jgi:hypothetical protein
MERGQSPCVCSRRTSNRKVTEGDDCRLVYSSNLNAIVRARWPHLDSNHSETLSKPPFSKKLKLHLLCWLISNPNLHELVHPDNAKTKNHCDTRENACKRAVMHTAVACNFHSENRALFVSTAADGSEHGPAAAAAEAGACICVGWLVCHSSRGAVNTSKKVSSDTWGSAVIPKVPAIDHDVMNPPRYRNFCWLYAPERRTTKHLQRVNVPQRIWSERCNGRVAVPILCKNCLENISGIVR